MVGGLATKATGIVLDVARQCGGAMPGVATLHDHSRFGNDGVMTNVTWVQIPPFGLWVMVFNGTDSDVALPVVDWSGDITILAWISLGTYPWSDGKEGIFCGNENALALIRGFYVRFYHHNVATGMSVRFNVGTGVASVSANSGYLRDWVANQFYFFAFVNDQNGNIELYRDCVSLASAAGGAMASSAVTPHIGQASYFNGYHFLGLGGLIKMYNYALTPAQIRARFSATRRFFGR